MVVVKKARRKRMVVRGTRAGGGVMIDAGMTAGKSEKSKLDVRVGHSVQATG